MTQQLTEFVLQRLLPSLQCDYCGARAGTGLILTASQHYPKLNALGIQTSCLVCSGFGSGVFAVPDWLSEADKPAPISDEELEAARESLEQPDWWQRLRA